MKKAYDVLSPDGFSISFSDVYRTKKAAKIALTQWCKNYERQGYYSSNGGRISLDELPYHCEIVPKEYEKEDFKNLNLVG